MCHLPSYSIITNPLDTFTLTNLHACLETPILYITTSLACIASACALTSLACIASACALTSSAASAINDIATNYSVCGLYIGFIDYTLLIILTLHSSGQDYLKYVKCESSLIPKDPFNGHTYDGAHVNIVLIVDVNHDNNQQTIYLRDTHDLTCMRLKQLYPDSSHQLVRANLEGIYKAYVKVSHPVVNHPNSNGLFTITHSSLFNRERWAMWVAPRPDFGIAESNNYRVTSKYSPILSQTINGWHASLLHNTDI